MRTILKSILQHILQKIYKFLLWEKWSLKCIIRAQFGYFVYQRAKFKYTALWAAECLSSVKMAKMKIDTFPSLVFAQ